MIFVHVILPITNLFIMLSSNQPLSTSVTLYKYYNENYYTSLCKSM